MNSLEKRRTFVLGAGFSAGAGIPTTNKLLHKALKLMEIECYGLYQKIEDYAKICFKNDLSIIDQNLETSKFIKLSSYLHYVEMTEFGGGERWCDNGSREILTLKYFISKAIAKSTPDSIPELYLDFANQLTCYETIITFNYDCLLEKSLEQVGKEYTYNFHELDWVNHPNRVFIAKMHGSINWMFSEDNRIDSSIYKKGFDPAMDLKPFYYSEILTNKELWDKENSWLRHIQNKNFIQPFIILPGIGKSYDVRKLGFFWYKPSACFYSNRDAIIIGLSLSEDDFFIRFLLLESFPLDSWDNIERRTIIINSNCKDMSNYNFIPKDQKFVRVKEFDLEDIEFFKK